MLDWFETEYQFDYGGFEGDGYDYVAPGPSLPAEEDSSSYQGENGSSSSSSSSSGSGYAETYYASDWAF